MIANRLFHRDKSPRSKGLTLPWAVSAASLLFLSVLVARAPAATPPNAPQPFSIGGLLRMFSPSPAAPLPAARQYQPPRDPTVPGPLLRALLKPTGKQQPSRPPELPAIQVKGRIIGGRRPDSALLQIDTRLYFVQKGPSSRCPSPGPIP